MTHETPGDGIDTPFTAQQVEQGRRLLLRMLPSALVEAVETKIAYDGLGDANAVMHAHMTIERFEAIVIHEGERGGWVVDLLLRDMPAGIGNIIGTPTDEPLSSYQLAEEGAFAMLVAFICVVRANKPELFDPVFQFHGSVFQMPQRALDRLIADGWGSEKREHMMEALRLLEAGLFPKGYTEAALQALPADAHLFFHRTITLALAMGILRYPPDQAMPPASHPGTETRH